MKKISLIGNDWKLIYVKNDRLKKDGESSDINELIKRGYPVISAEVPGNLEIDLQRAGVIDDPFFADNFYDRSCEYLHMYYYRTFNYDGSLENPKLIFEGLDTVAEIYLNGVLIGKTDNMLIEHSLSVSGAIKSGENLIVVHIIPAVIAAREYPMTSNENAQRYNMESLYIRKAPHMYGWDILPRIVSGGIWKPLYLAEQRADRITELYGYTVSMDTSLNTATLLFHFNIEASADEIQSYSMQINGKCGESEFCNISHLYHTGGFFRFDINNVKFWWPKNYGNANIYDVDAVLLKDGKEIDRLKTRMGIRTVELIRTSNTNETGDGEFCFKVNGKRIFCMGTNWVPADALHSRDAERIPKILPMLNDTNCNIIRVWGGNVYENDMLYDFCDENGIMIWQDFVMGCAIYPQDDDFAKRFATEAAFAVKRLRMHPSIIVWAGDNENDVLYAQGWHGISRNPNKNRLTREVLPRVLEMHDHIRPYLPSSPYVDEEAYKHMDKPLPEDHLWGPRDYFKGNFYKNALCHFASETGYHGCASPDSIKKFVPNEYVWTAKNNKDWDGIDNKMWIAHATAMENVEGYPYVFRIKLMSSQVTTLFGETVPNTLCDFAKASQISQAEAKKYFIERTRVSKWRRTGIIWWNIMDGWPQISDAVVDYYFCKKLAYHYIKRSQNPLCLIFDEPENDGKAISLYAVNEHSENKKISYRVTDLTENKVVASGTGLGEGESSTLLCTVPIKPDEKHFYFIEWECDGEKGTNHYMTNIIDIDYKEYMGYIEKCGYDEFEGFGE